LFRWDPRKAASNVRKHGVTFEEASTVFGDPRALIFDDEVELDRSVIVGHSLTQRLLVAVFVEIRQDAIRIISARRASKHERSRYEQGQ